MNEYQTQHYIVSWKFWYHILHVLIEHHCSTVNNGALIMSKVLLFNMM